MPNWEKRENVVIVAHLATYREKLKGRYTNKSEVERQTEQLNLYIREQFPFLDKNHPDKSAIYWHIAYLDNLLLGDRQPADKDKELLGFIPREYGNITINPADGKYNSKIHPNPLVWTATETAAVDEKKRNLKAIWSKPYHSFETLVYQLASDLRRDKPVFQGSSKSLEPLFWYLIYRMQLDYDVRG